MNARTHDDVLIELHRCATTRRIRQNELLAALVMVDALDRRITDLIDELDDHHHETGTAPC